VNRLPRKTDATGFAARKYCSGAKKCTAHKSENIDALEEVVLSQEDAPVIPAIHRILRHFEHKHYIIVNLTFPYWKYLFLIPVFNIIIYISETVW